jgi:hypothetical protein
VGFALGELGLRVNQAHLPDRTACVLDVPRAYICASCATERRARSHEFCVCLIIHLRRGRCVRACAATTLFFYPSIPLCSSTLLFVSLRASRPLTRTRSFCSPCTPPLSPLPPPHSSSPSPSPPLSPSILLHPHLSDRRTRRAQGVLRACSGRLGRVRGGDELAYIGIEHVESRPHGRGVVIKVGRVCLRRRRGQRGRCLGLLFQFKCLPARARSLTDSTTARVTARPSPTLSPTDPVPRGLLTLCPGASSGPQGQ